MSPFFRPLLSKSLPSIPTTVTEVITENEKLLDMQYRYYVEKYCLNPNASPKSAMIELAKRLDNLERDRRIAEFEKKRLKRSYGYDEVDHSSTNHYFEMINRLSHLLSCDCTECAEKKFEEKMKNNVCLLCNEKGCAHMM